MTAVLVDSNVLINITMEDAEWRSWSEAALAACAKRWRLVINPLIYAEVSVGFESVEALDASLSLRLLEREPLPWAAAFLAGQCFVTYRRRGGARTSPLPDFFIGAHAAVAGYRLLTRDVARYRAYFPTVELIAPDQAS